MRPRPKPFTVELRSSRKSASTAPATTWGEMLDEPAAEDLPIRNARGYAAAEPNTSFDAARVFSAFATNAVTTVAAFNGLAASVFAPRPAEPTIVDELSATPRPEELPRGRILPSLVPLNRFEGEDGVRADPATFKARRRKSSLRAARPIKTERAEAPLEVLARKTTAWPDGQPNGTETADPPGVRRSKRVPAGERWKRRRLPKACW
jgi:hypothetical protein